VGSEKEKRAKSRRRQVSTMTRRHERRAAATLLLLLVSARICNAFLPRSAVLLPRQKYPSSWMVASALPVDTTDAAFLSSTLSLAETESWRQYVPLAVSLLVIVDILLGSPVANKALSALRPENEEILSREEGGSPFQTLSGKAGESSVTGQKERVDTMAIAQKALDKAEATKELRRFLDEGKSDYDKMRDIQDKMDADLQAFDEKQKKKKEGS
jgi:hypothetical protein